MVPELQYEQHPQQQQQIKMAEDAPAAGIPDPLAPGLLDEQQEHDGERPLYITTASPYIEEAA